MFIKERVDGMKRGNSRISKVVLAIEFLEMEVYRNKAGYGFNAF